VEVIRGFQSSDDKPRLCPEQVHLMSKGGIQSGIHSQEEERIEDMTIHDWHGHPLKHIKDISSPDASSYRSTMS
jgi:hypothetical protein